MIVTEAKVGKNVNQLPGVNPRNHKLENPSDFFHILVLAPCLDV